MITITVKRFEDFKNFFANNRAANHLFYDIRQCEKEASALRLVNLHFLGVIGTLNILFQHLAEVPAKMEASEFVARIKAEMVVEGMGFVEGTIREIFLSLS